VWSSYLQHVGYDIYQQQFTGAFAFFCFREQNVDKVEVIKPGIGSDKPFLADNR
jgi:hypothetical protein